MRLTAKERRIRRERAHDMRVREDRDERNMHHDEIMREYEKAYAAANGRDIRLQYTSGWVRQAGVVGGTAFTWGPHRVRELPRMAQQLWARVHEQELGQ